MDNADRGKGSVSRYLFWTFTLAYIVQGVVWLLYQKGLSLIATAVMTALMFVPLLGVLLAGGNLREFGWRPRIRKNLRHILFAWLSPAVLTALGALLYFLIFPEHFDLSGSYLQETAGASALEQLKAEGITYPAYLAISAVSTVICAPFLNMIAALGEEVGWRGFLYPRLKARYGETRGSLFGGLIWGAWHWPLIWLIGYEYGSDYPGFPVVGMLLFCIFTVVLGFLCDRLCEKSGSIWLPSLFHGAVNAAAGIPLLICVTGTASARLLGPAPNGLISGLPFIAAAVFFFVKSARKKPEI